MNHIQASIINGKTYYETTVSGVEYCASEMAGGWICSARRLRSAGKVRRFDTLADLVSSVKAFASLDVMIACEAVA